MSNPPTVTPPILRGALVKDDNTVSIGWNKVNITSQTTTLIKTGAGFLYGIVIGTPVSGGTIEIDDAIMNTNSFGIITSGGAIPYFIPFKVAFTTGLSITTAVHDQNITVLYV